MNCYNNIILYYDNMNHKYESNFQIENLNLPIGVCLFDTWIDMCYVLTMENSSRIKLATGFPSASTEYSVFLEKYFSKSSDWILQLPPDLIENGIRLLKWVSVEARTNDGQLIGVIFSIPFDEFYAPGFQGSPLRNLGLVDYFCVHPSWRRSGVGTALLHKLFATTKLFGRKAHIFASEGSIFTLFHKIPQKSILIHYLKLFPSFLLYHH